MNTQRYALAVGMSVGLMMNLAAAAAPLRTLTLQWSANPQPVTGYEVYYGKTATPARMRPLPVPTSLNLAAPAVQFHVLRDLGALPGQQVCFRVKAYDNTSQSPFSHPICTDV